MNWLQRKALSWIVKRQKNPFVAMLRQALQGGMVSAKEKAFLESYKGWVFACVNVIAQGVGNMVIRLFETDDEEEEDKEVFEHKALQTLHKPNSLMGKEELFEITSSHLDLDGNAFWFLVKDDAGEPIQIFPLRPERTQEILDEDNPLEIFEYIYVQEGGAQIHIPKDDIIHFKSFNPNGKYPFPTRGMGVVEGAAEIIDTDDFARQWNRNYFLNNARPDAILTYEGDMSDEELKRIQEQWNLQHRGLDKSNRTALLKGGMKYEPVSTTPKDMDFVEQRRFSRDEILAMFRIPKSILGITEDVNRANAEAGNFIFGLRVLKPRYERIIEILNEFYLPLFSDSEDLFFEADSPVPEDRTQILNEYQFGINKWLTRNDIRRREGLPDTEEGDTFFGPFSELPQDSVKKTAKRYRLRTKRRKTKLVLKDLKDKGKTRETVFQAKEVKKAIVKERFKKLWLKSIDIKTGRLKIELDLLFDSQEKAVKENIKTELEGLETKEYKLKQLSSLFDLDSSISATIDLIAPFQREFAEDAVNQSLLLTGGEVGDIDFASAEFQKFFDERSKFFAEKINETTMQDLFGEIETGFKNDETVDEISERIAGVFDKARDFRTDRIARTEVASLSNFANQEAYRQLGIEKHEWLIANPEDIDCLQVANEIVKLGEPFSNGHIKPPVHPNCVCVTIPVVE